MTDGRLLFARYAVMPNRLGYCGGPNASELLDYCVEGQADAGLDRLIHQFQAAYPYLRFIADATGVGDPLDARVVEAYWLGNELLAKVDPVRFDDYLHEKIGKRIPDRLKAYVLPKARAGARPHHSFHVLDVSMPAGALPYAVEQLDRCRIAWGRVLSVQGDLVNVLTAPVTYEGGQLVLAPPAPRVMHRSVDGKGYLQDLRSGDLVSSHWDWVCDRIQPAQAERLRRETLRHIDIANGTL